MYCSAADILPLLDQDRVKRLLGVDDENGRISDEHIAPFITAAQDEINAGLGSYYVLPISGAQSLMIIKGIAVGLTLGMIYEPSAVGMMYLAGAEGVVPERIKSRIARARLMLDTYAGVMGTRGVINPLRSLPDAPTQGRILSKSNALLDVDLVLGSPRDRITTPL